MIFEQEVIVTCGFHHYVEDSRAHMPMFEIFPESTFRDELQ
jgi:hypothetical protein